MMSSVVSNPSSITCSCTLEWVSKTGMLNKSVKIKTATLQIVRNEFRDIYLAIQAKDINHRLLLKDVIIFKKFVEEGKATLKFPNEQRNILMYNAPPTTLIVFLKTIFIKLCSTKCSPKATIREKLLSTKEKFVQEVSPINAKDVGRVKTVPIANNGKRPAEGGVDVVSEAKKQCLSAKSDSLKISNEQERVLHEVMRGSNVFFTGSAGTGKSYLLQAVINALPPEYTLVTASTGSAACLIGGITLHSFAGIGSGEGTLEKCLQLAKRPHIQQNWKRCRHLIIDEISMIDSELFEKIEWIAKQIRGNDKVFGGIQLIVCGDFLQLPPVKNTKNRFCFMSPTWDECNFNVFYLKQVHRQNDSEFITILNSIRLGQVSTDMTERLQNTATQNIERDGILATRLCCHTNEAKRINDSKLENLQGDRKIFEGVDIPNGANKLLDDCTPVEKCLVLKEGAQVMLLKNINVGQGLVNGARGVITKFVNGMPVIKFLTGVTFEVKYENWTIKTAQGATLTRKQLPLRLAWAFSIHKSQGLTLDCVELCLSNTFEAGQAYVALSRAKSLNSVRVLDFQARQVWANPEVLNFYKRISRHQREFIPLGRKMSLPKSQSTSDMIQKKKKSVLTELRKTLSAGGSGYIKLGPKL